MNLGTTELLIIVVLVVVIFGAGWLPKAARTLGRTKVEVERTQQQLTDAKQQVIEATGLEKAEETLRKANRTLNQSPKKLVKDAATGAMVPKKKPEPEAPAPDVVDPVEVDDASDADTINLDWSD